MKQISKGARIAVTGIKDYEDIKDLKMDDIAKKIVQYVKHNLVLNCEVLGEIEVDAQFIFMRNRMLMSESVVAQMMCDENYNIAVKYIERKIGKDWVVEKKTYE